MMSISPSCKCCRRWNRVGTNLIKLLLKGMDDDDDDDGEDCGVAGCTNSNSNSTADGSSRHSVMFPSLLPLICCNTAENIQHERKSSIPIQLRLAIMRTIRTTSHHGNTTTNKSAEDFLSVQASPANFKLLTYFPPLSWDDETSSKSSTNAAANATTNSKISDFMQYVVEDLFIDNKEGNFLVHDRSNFVTTLLGNIDREESNEMEFSFRYGKNTTYRSFGVENRSTTAGPSTCVVDFSLLVETEERNPIEISPSDDAHEAFRNLVSSQVKSSSKRLDLILKAHVRILTAGQVSAQRTLSSHAPYPEQSTKRKCSRDDYDGQDTKLRKLETDVIRTNGIPPSLSKAWENQKAAPSIVNSSVNKYDGESDEEVYQQHRHPKDAEHDMEGAATHKTMKIAPKHVRPASVGAIGTKSAHDSQRSNKVDSDFGETNMTIENITEPNIEINDTIESNVQGADSSADDDTSSSSSSSNEEDESKDDVETIGKSSSEDEQSEAEFEHDDVGDMIAACSNSTMKSAEMARNASSLRSTLSSGTETNNICDSSWGKNISTIPQSEEVDIASVAMKESDSSESSSSSSSDSESSSSSSSDDDSEILLSQSTTVTQTVDGKNEILITNLPFASGKTTPSVSAIDNNAIYTQESEIVPTILFEDVGNRTVSAPTQKNEKQVENSSSSSSDDDSSSSNSSSSVSDESDDEDDRRRGEVKEGTEIGKNIDKAAPSNSDVVLLKKDGSSFSSGGNVAFEQRSGSGEKASDNSHSSTSSSSTDSSSSSDGSSDTDTSNSSGEDEEVTKIFQSDTPVSGSIPPVVQSSTTRGRRRTPLVSANRKIVITTTTRKR